MTAESMMLAIARINDLEKEFATYRADVEPVLMAAIAFKAAGCGDQTRITELFAAVSASRECQRIAKEKP